MNQEKDKPAEQTPAETPEAEVAQAEQVAADSSQAESQPVEQLQRQAEQIAELENRLLRLHADFDNYRKRTLRDRDEQVTLAEMALLRSMLPVLDNFDRALAVLPQEEAAWAEGVRLVHRQWLNVLAEQGLTAVDCLSQPFDPNLHEAVMRDESGEAEEGTILQELQRGYQYKSKLLRPSMVKVAVHPTSS